MDNLVSAYFLGLFPSSSSHRCYKPATQKHWLLSKCCLYSPTLGSLLKPFLLIKCTFIPVSMLRPIRGLLSQRGKMTSSLTEASQTCSSVRINLSPSYDPPTQFVSLRHFTQRGAMHLFAHLAGLSECRGKIFH